MMKKILLLLVVIGALGAVGAALAMQHGQGLAPCTLCIIQRYAFLGVGLCALIALLMPVRSLRLALGTIGIAAAIGGMIAAVKNFWVMAHPEILCGRDPVELFLNDLPTAHWFPQVFVASGLCSSPIPPLFGLALPAWSLIGLLTLSILFGLALRKR